MNNLPDCAEKAKNSKQNEKYRSIGFSRRLPLLLLLPLLVLLRAPFRLLMLLLVMMWLLLMRRLALLLLLRRWRPSSLLLLLLIPLDDERSSTILVIDPLIYLSYKYTYVCTDRHTARASTPLPLTTTRTTQRRRRRQRLRRHTHGVDTHSLALTHTRFYERAFERRLGVFFGVCVCGWWQGAIVFAVLRRDICIMCVSELMSDWG